MLTFTRIFIGDIIIKETNSKLKNCKLYEVFDIEKRIRRFYSGDNFSFIDIDDDKFRIKKTSHFFKRSEYYIYHQFSGLLFGKYNIPNNGYLDMGKCHLLLENGTTYEWQQNKNHRRLLNQKTWSIYKFHFYSPDLQIIYSGKMLPDTIAGLLNYEQVFQGEILTTGVIDFKIIFSGLYIVEEHFRRIEQSPR